MRSLDGHRTLSKFRIRCRSYPCLIMHIISSEDYKRYVLRRHFVLICVCFQLLAQFQHLLSPVCFPKCCLVREHLPHTKLSATVLRAFAFVSTALFHKRKGNVVAWTKMSQLATFSVCNTNMLTWDEFRGVMQYS